MADTQPQPYENQVAATPAASAGPSGASSNKGGVSGFIEFATSVPGIIRIVTWVRSLSFLPFLFSFLFFPLLFFYFSLRLCGMSVV